MDTGSVNETFHHCPQTLPSAWLGAGNKTNIIIMIVSQLRPAPSPYLMEL